MPLASVLGVQAFATDSPLINGWVGLHFGSVTTFTQPTFPGGSLVIVHAQAGSWQQWGLGNRAGLFTRKAIYIGFEMMRNGLAGGADTYARRMIAGTDPDVYARDLGFDVSPAAEPVRDFDAPEGDPGVALRRLQTLRDEGLITDTEYASKRVAIVDRL